MFSMKDCHIQSIVFWSGSRRIMMTDPSTLRVIPYQNSLLKWLKNPCLTAPLNSFANYEKETIVMVSYSHSVTVVKIFSLAPTVHYV